MFTCEDVAEDIEYVFKRALDMFKEVALIEKDYFLFHVRFLGYENAIHLYAQQPTRGARSAITDYVSKITTRAKGPGGLRGFISKSPRASID
jgi:hypothetical protein